MSIISTYSFGRVSVAQGSNQVTGVDTAWIAGAIREGDYLWVNGLTVRVSSVIDNTNLLLAFPWPGASVNNSIYEIRYTPDAQRVLGSSRELINLMNKGGLAPIGSLIPETGGMIHYTGSNTAEILKSGVKGRELIQAENEQQAQNTLDLIPQSNLIDATLNRLLKTGSFGLGAVNAPLLDNINRIDIPAGFYRVNKTTTLGTKPPLADVADSLIVLHPTPSQTTQIYLGMTENGRNYIRKGNSTSSWSPWRSIVLDFESGTGPGSNLDADMVDGYHASDFVLKSEMGQGSILDIIREADGEGSGIDADLLDGFHATEFGMLSEASTWAAVQSFNGGIRTAASVHDQAHFGYGKTGINPTLSFYSNTTRTGFIQDGASAGLAIVSGAGGQLLVAGSGVVNINGKQLATREYTDAQISALVNSAPSTLNTLNKLSAALGNDPNFATTVTNQIASKLDASVYTAADILNKIKTVDGTGSGLDADTLAGISSGSFIRNDLGNGQSLNSSITVTNYSNIKASAAATANIGYMFYDENTVEKARLYWQRDNNTIYLRNRGNDGASWHHIAIGGDGVLSFNGNKIFHSGNHGPNSGLDADTVDGIHAVNFALKSELNLISANVRKNTFNATRAPLPSDEETQGYEVGSRWLWQGQEWVRGEFGWVPVIAPSHRQWGLGNSFTLTPSNDWQSIIESYDGTGTITLANGTYTATRRLKPRGKPFLRGETLGGATIIANWEFLQGTGVRFWEINMAPQDKTDLWLRATMAYVDFRDVVIDAADPSFVMTQFASCGFSDIRFTASLRNLNIDLGPNIGEGWDFDSNCNVKVAANTTDKRVRLINRVPAGSERQFWVFDQSRMICDGLNILNPLGAVGGIGISARRATMLTFQQSEAAVDGPHNTITGQVRAMILRQNSQASFQGTEIKNNNRGIQTQDGGSYSFPNGGLDLSSNTVDHDNINATTGVQVMGVTRPTLLTFTSAGTMVPAGSTWYLGLAYAGPDLAIARIRVPRNGTLKNLSVRANLGPGAGQTFTVLVYRSSADTPLSVTINDTTTSGENTTNIVKVSSGDAICIKVVTSAGAAARAFTVTMDLE